MNLIGAEFVLDDWWAAIDGRDDDAVADDVVFDRSKLRVRDELTEPAEPLEVDALELVGLTVLNCN